MRTKKLHKDQVNIITLGCSKNIVDSEVLLTQLQANGIEASHESTKKGSNVIIVNTCGFIEKAKEESIQTILAYAEAKEKGEIDKLYVTGCLSQRYREDLKGEIPEVDSWFGTLELPMLLNRLGADYKHELIGERVTTTSPHYAYLKISEGCDRPCSFCAIPIMRGKHVSKPMEQIITEATNLVGRGVKEIMLIAQDLTYYGLDVYRKRNLHELLEKLEDVEGLEWIRLHYAYPASFPYDILPVMRNSKKICRYMDIPLQSGSSAVLKAMRRGIDRPKTEELIKRIREEVPGIALRTTLITGHPGETQEDHEENMKFVEDMKFERMGVFTYSHEDGTHAYEKMKDDLTQEEKDQRAAELMEIQQEISYSFNKQLIGKKLKVLFDRKEGEYFVGRTEYDSPEVDNEVLVSAKDHFVRLGDFAEVTITQAEPFDLYGKI